MRLVSIVLPTLKEDGIAASLDALAAHVAELGDAFELLVVDDSPDDYKRRIEDYIAAHQARLAPRVTVRLVAGPRRGKGAAVREGVLASRGDVVFTMDADLPVPLENIARFLALIDDGADVIVGERPVDRNISQPLRFIASRALFALQRVLVFQSRAFDDTQCGFKAFRGDLARRLASRQVVEGGMVDIEYLYAAGHARARFARAAVTSVPETRATKINVKRAIVRDPIDLIRIKWAGIRGRYRS
jgi:glycosyltransferase involved in cell wall biosynthesis